MSDWRWRNMRDVAFSLHVYPLPWGWRFQIERWSCLTNWSFVVCCGPVCVRIVADIGDCSSENPFVAWCGLSEYEAAERAGLDPQE